MSQNKRPAPARPATEKNRANRSDDITFDDWDDLDHRIKAAARAERAAKAKAALGGAWTALSDAALRVTRAFFMCLGMFTSIPCPYRPWDEDARGLMLATLPIVGAVIGLLWAAAGLLATAFLPGGLRAAVVTATPLALSGFIHLDGFMDTSDALLSWRPLEKRLEILKDTHTGAYSVVNLALLLMLTYGAAQSGIDPRALALVPVISRCGSALCVLSLRPIEHSEYANLQGRAVQRAAVVAIWAVAMLAGALWLRAAALALLVETLAYAAAMLWAAGALKGVSGDLAGFALTISETAALIALAVPGGIK